MKGRIKTPHEPTADHFNVLCLICWFFNSVAIDTSSKTWQNIFLQEETSGDTLFFMDYIFCNKATLSTGRRKRTQMTDRWWPLVGTIRSAHTALRTIVT